MIVDRKLSLYFFTGLLLLAALLVAVLFFPYLDVFLVSGVLAIIFHPVHRRLKRAFGNRPALAALVSTLIACIVLLGPVGFVGTRIFAEARSLYTSLSQNGDVLGRFGLDDLESSIKHYAPHLEIDFGIYIRQALDWMMQNVGSTISTATNFLLGAFLSIIALYYLFKDGHHFRRVLIKASPLPDRYDEEIIAKLNQTVNSIVRGNLVIALIQGSLTGVGFALFGVPNALLWGSIASVAALLPGIGTALILTPGIIFLFATDATPQAIGLLIWGVLAVGLIDNLLGPKLIGRGARIHPLLVLISVLGGLRLFGPVGFLAGPLAVSFLLALFHIYSIWARSAYEDGPSRPVRSRKA